MSTAAKFGMLCEAEEIHKGNPIKFLGRIYIDPWTTNQSICDVKRQLRKLHLTASPAVVPDYVVLYRKALGYRVTDAATPIMTPWCDAVLRLTKPLNPEKHSSFKMTASDSVYWSKFTNPFVAPTDTQNTYGLVAQQLGLTVAEVLGIEDRLNKAMTLDDIKFTGMFHTALDQTITVVHAGEVKQCPKKLDTQSKIKANLNLPEPVFCRRFANGTCRYGSKCKYSHVTLAPKTAEKVTPVAKIKREPSKVVKAPPRPRNQPRTN